MEAGRQDARQVQMQAQVRVDGRDRAGTVESTGPRDTGRGRQAQEKPRGVLGSANWCAPAIVRAQEVTHLFTRFPYMV